jgi:hypothetical protein
MEHTDPVEALFARVKEADVPMYMLCDRAGVARSTPSRWRSEKNGATVSSIAALDAALTRIIAERAEQRAAA